MTATDHALELVAVAAQAAHDKKADQVLAFDVSDQLEGVVGGSHAESLLELVVVVREVVLAGCSAVAPAAV